MEEQEASLLEEFVAAAERSNGGAPQDTAENGAAETADGNTNGETETASETSEAQTGDPNPEEDPSASSGDLHGIPGRFDKEAVVRASRDVESGGVPKLSFYRSAPEPVCGFRAYSCRRQREYILRQYIQLSLRRSQALPRR